MKTLILYLTNDGQTKKIAEKLAEQIRHETLVLDLKDNEEKAKSLLAEYDQIVIGASIRYGHFQPTFKRFVDQNQPVLNAKKSAFFSVNLTARKADKNTAETNVYTRKVLERIQWKPTTVEVFAGALLYPRYNFFDRVMIQFIMKITGGETDKTKEVEYTDWDKVKKFAEKLEG